MSRVTDDASDDGKRTCVFCGADDLSKEHVLPRWLWREAHKEDDRRAPLLSRETSQFEEVHLGGGEPPLYLPVGTMPTIRSTAVRVKVVCRTCNQGWMSALEAAAQRPLRRMFYDPSWSLAADEVQTLRRWAAKTALMHEFATEADAPTLGTQAMLDAVRDDAELPGTWHMGLARTRSVALQFGMSMTPLMSSKYPMGDNGEYLVDQRSSYPFAMQHLISAWSIVFIVRYSPYKEVAPASLWHDLWRYPRGNPVRLTEELAGRRVRTKHLPDFVRLNFDDLTNYWGHTTKQRDSFTCVRLEEDSEPVIVRWTTLATREQPEVD